jgi:hypothetical protein
MAVETVESPFCTGFPLPPIAEVIATVGGRGGGTEVELQYGLLPFVIDDSDLTGRVEKKSLT